MGDLGDVDRAEKRERRERAAPSLSGRLVEAQAAVRALRDALFDAARAAKAAEGIAAGVGETATDCPPGVPPPWLALDEAMSQAVEAEKALLNVGGAVLSARIRGWES